MAVQLISWCSTSTVAFSNEVLRVLRFGRIKPRRRASCGCLNDAAMCDDRTRTQWPLASNGSSSRACQVLQRLRAETARAVPKGARMQISPEQGQLMGLLVEAVGARRAIEVGTFTGYSSIAIAQVRAARQIGRAANPGPAASLLL